MKKRLSYISPFRLGIVEGVTMAIVSLLVLVPFLLLGAFEKGHGAATNPIALPIGVIAVIFPVGYAIFGFIAGVIAAIIYNIVAKFTGGIVYIAEEAN